MMLSIDWTSISAVTVEDIQKHMKELLAQVNMRIFVIGNMFKDVSNVFDIDRQIWPAYKY